MTMSTETNTVSADTDDLDAFNDLLNGNATEPSESEEPADTEDVSTHEDTDDTLATEHDDIDQVEDESEADDSESEEEEEESEAEPEPKPAKKNRAKERIDELTRNFRESERQRLALEDRLAKLENPVETKPTEQVKPTNDANAPTPNDKDEYGEDKYPLGEFDPAYIRDLTRFTIKQENEAYEAQRAEKAKQAEYEKAQEILRGQWNEKLEGAKERYPDMAEVNAGLEDTFTGIDPAYGEYLASAIMAMDYGPDVLYHLGTNLSEAKKIVAAGPAQAMIALGRIEARFAIEAEEKAAIKKQRVSKAPTPPDRVNKGSAVSSVVPDDTDDLDAFSAKMFGGFKR